jgi:hypothetical protein
MKEIDLQLQEAAETAKVPARFFALGFGENGVTVNAGDSLEEIDPITPLDMEIEQSERYRDWYYRSTRA